MNRPTVLLAALLADAGRCCGVSTARDVETIRHRVQNEGYSFLTMTLPILSDALERGIEEGRLGTEVSRKFRFHPRERRPVFMRGFFARVFDDTGYLLEKPCADAILCIRQISRSFKKIFELCSPSRNAAAAAHYLSIEEELKTHDGIYTKPDPILDETARHIGRYIVDVPPRVDRSEGRQHRPGSAAIAADDQDDGIGQEICSDATGSLGRSSYDHCDRSFDCSAAQILEVRHGPGVTADRRSPNGRFSISTWHRRGLEIFPLADYAIPNWKGISDLRNIRILDEEEEPPVRVVFVPKTALTPRVIAVEPSHMQYLQQGVMKWMVDDLERSPITRGHVNFSDQSINQQLACRGSISRWLATIDMKDASDRVHKDLARRILRYTPYWPWLEGSRSRTATLPNGTTVSLRKFASMGSATCFPVEAYVFYCLVISAIHVRWKQVPTRESVMQASRDVYVYGDDIVIPTQHVDYVCEYLESFGLRVNRNKSFANSHFRESCGADFFAGQAVKPVYFRQHLPSPNVNWTPKQVLAWVASANQLYLAGWWTSAQLIRDWVEKEVGSIPRMRIKPHAFSSYGRKAKDDSTRYDNPNGVAWASVVFNTKLRWSQDLQSFGWRVLDFRTKKEEDPVQTMSGALLKAFSNIGMEHSTDFSFSNRRGVLTPKRRWVGLAADSNL